MCITKACEEPTAEGVWWRDDAEWRQYDAAEAAIIQRAIKDGTKRVQLGNLASSKYARGASYVVDLTTMKQLNVATGYTRDVKIVASNDPAGNSVNLSDLVPRLMEEVRACQEVIQSLKQKVKKLEGDVSAFKVAAANSAITEAQKDASSCNRSRIQRIRSRELQICLGVLVRLLAATTVTDFGELSK